MTDQAYHRRRAEQERLAAERAGDPYVAKLHEILAAEHDLLAAVTDEVAPGQQHSAANDLHFTASASLH